jgi:hypothetical protein
MLVTITREVTPPRLITVVIAVIDDHDTIQLPVPQPGDLDQSADRGDNGTQSQVPRWAV